MELAPIIVFGYNRPEHYQRTLEALSKNRLAEESILYLYCDGAKEGVSADALEKIAAVRTIAHEQHWAKETHVIESETNKGLADSIISGVTDVVNRYGSVIVLEDDLVTSEYFLTYTNKSLDFYADRPTVFSIGGYQFPLEKMPIPKDYPYDTYVSLRASSWGWATWKDRWNRVDWSMDYLSDLLKHPYEQEAWKRGGEDMLPMLIQHNKGEINSWAIRFCFAHFHEHAVSILPTHSYVSNIGCDGSGVHCAATNQGVSPLSNEFKGNFVDNLYEDKRIINAFANVYSRVNRPLWQKTCNWIARKLGKPAPFTIKKKIYA